MPWHARPAVLTIVLIALSSALLIAATAARAASPDLTLLQTGTAAHAAATTHAVATTLGPGAAGVFAAPARSGAPSTAGGLLRVTLALIVVLGAIFGAGWLSRRVHGTRGARHPGLEVLAQLPLGPRERAVLIRVGAQQLLIGVCGGGIRTLHVCAPDGAAAGAAATGFVADRAAGADLTAVSAASAADAATVAAAALTRPTFKSLLLKSLGR